MTEKGSSTRTDRLKLGARALPIVSLRLTSDERLLARVRRGDSGAFEALYDRHAAALLSFCFFILGSREDAEDAVQSTFAAAYRALLRDEREIDARPWLYAIARNACFGILRKRRPQDNERLAQLAGEDLVVQVERRESVRHLLTAMLELPERHRTALILAELHGHSQREIGHMLDVSPSTVKSYVFQARTALTSELSAREADCNEIRAELSSARGPALLRGPLRRHLRACEGCSEYAAQISRRRRELGALLPLLPSLALKRRVLDATASKAGGASALGSASVGTGAGGTTLTGGIELGGVGVKALLAKVLVLAAGLGASAGAGTLVLSAAHSQPPRSTVRAPSSLADAAWRGPRTSPARVGSVHPLATPSTSAPAPAGVSQPSAVDSSGTVELPRAKQAAHAGSDDATGAVGRASVNGKGSDVEHGKSAEHGKSGEAHGVAKGNSAEHAHAAHGKPEDTGKSAAHIDQGAKGKAVGHGAGPHTSGRSDGHGHATDTQAAGKPVGRPAAGPVDPSKGGASSPAAGPQGTTGTGRGGSAAGHGAPVSPPTTEDSPNGHAEAPDSALPAAGAHGPQGEAAYGSPAGHGSTKG